MQIILNFQDILIILLISFGKSSLMVIKPGRLLSKQQILTTIRDVVLIFRYSYCSDSERQVQLACAPSFEFCGTGSQKKP